MDERAKVLMWFVCDGCGKHYDVDGNSGVCLECGKVGEE